MKVVRHNSCLILAALVILTFCNTLVLAETVFTEGFETGWGGWSASNGVWEIGKPTDGPPSSHGGTQCAATVLNGNYPSFTVSRLVSPSIILPLVTGNEEIHLRFWNWFSYTGGYGSVQISTYNSSTGIWSSYIAISDNIGGTNPIWTPMDVDLTQYAGKKVRIGFTHVPENTWGYTNTGWYIDDVVISNIIPAFSGDFETGWGGWSASNGVWEIGKPTDGPPSSHGGTQCAATVLNGNYPSFTVSRLVSPSIILPLVTGNEEIHLRFWNWFSYTGGYGSVQISTYNSSTGIWSSYIAISDNIGGTNPIWTPMDVDLTQYAGKKVRIGFTHVPENTWGYTNTGWYIDDITIYEVPSTTPTACMSTLDGKLALHIPYISYDNPLLKTMSLWVDLVYQFNPTYSQLIFFKYVNSGIINDPFSLPFFCAASILSYDYKIHIPDLLLPDGSTHLWVDLEYSPLLSTEGNFYWVVSNYGVISN